MSAQHVTSNTNGRHSGTPASVPSIKVDNGTPIEQSAPPPKLEALASYLARPSLPLSRSNSFSGLAHLESKKNIILKSHGRPPWYGEDGQRVSDAFVIGIAGGSASGKTYVAQQIVRSLGNIPSVVIMSQDSFYKFHTPEEIELANMSRFDLDHPSAIDMPLFASCLQDLKECKQANIPIYSFTEHQRQSETKYLYGAAIIIAEGIMALQDPALRAIYDLKIFVQCDSDLMLARRIKRDVAERGRTVEGILEQYLRYVKPAYDNFVQPTSKYADIIVPGSQNSVAIDLISTHVRRMLDNRSNSFRDRLYVSGGLGDPSHRQSENLSVLPQTPQLNGIFTILRDRTTSRGDFVFYADRLATFIAEKAMEFLPFKPKSVVTPTEAIAEGKTLGTEFVCGISIIRSGGPLERGLQRVFRDIRIGSLLIQSDDKTGEPLLLHTMLPFCLRDRETAKDTWVYLLHAQIGTGAAAFMAVRILLDHGVQQDHIIFLTFLVSRSGGVSALNKAFPGVRILCGAVDDELVEGWLPAADSDDPHEGRKVWIVEPGMGHIGDRYYL